MNKEKRVKDWDRFYKSLTDPELRAAAKRESDKNKRLEVKKQDTGL